MGPQKGFRVSVPPRSSGAEIHQAILSLGGPQDEVHLLAGSALFLTPREICGLRALIEWAARIAGRVVFHSPASSDLHRYLARVNFYADLPGNVEVTLPVPALRRRDRRERLIELVRIRAARDVEVLFERVSGVASGQFGPGTAAARACATAVATATENAIEHARSPIGALVSAQRYQRTGLELAVVDLGRGIPATLRQNPLHRDLSDLDAVERSLEDGVSSLQELGRGAGLAELVRDVGRVGQATLRLSSGDAELTLGWENGRASVNRSIPASFVRGTWIAVRLDT
jgi:anti-sigma regulatory factor (Ser/Thr protein kinase)